MNAIHTGISPTPPGPKGYWALGNLPDFKGDLLGFLSGCARDHGGFVRLRLGRNPALLLNMDALSALAALGDRRDGGKGNY